MVTEQTKGVVSMFASILKSVGINVTNEGLEVEPKTMGVLVMGGSLLCSAIAYGSLYVLYNFIL